MLVPTRAPDIGNKLQLVLCRGPAFVTVMMRPAYGPESMHGRWPFLHFWHDVVCGKIYKQETISHKFRVSDATLVPVGFNMVLSIISSHAGDPTALIAVCNHWLQADCYNHRLHHAFVWSLENYIRR